LSDSISKKGRPIVFSAPSGAGKTTIIREVRKELPGLEFSVSSTTRPIRSGETAGVDYDYISHEEFEKAIQDDDFIEYEKVHIHYYGTRKSKVDHLLESGKDIIFDLDVLGALSIKRFYPESLLIYIDVLSKNVLHQRLISRGREDEAEIAKRLERYEMERSKASEFTFKVINDKLDIAVKEVVDIVRDYRNRSL